jgi:hypothetical protein
MRTSSDRCRTMLGLFSMYVPSTQRVIIGWDGLFPLRGAAPRTETDFLLSKHHTDDFFSKGPEHCPAYVALRRK